MHLAVTGFLESGVPLLPPVQVSGAILVVRSEILGPMARGFGDAPVSMWVSSVKSERFKRHGSELPSGSAVSAGGCPLHRLARPRKPPRQGQVPLPASYSLQISSRPVPRFASIYFPVTSKTPFVTSYQLFNPRRALGHTSTLSRLQEDFALPAISF